MCGVEPKSTKHHPNSAETLLWDDRGEAQMLAEDIYRNRLADLVSKLEAWAQAYRDTGSMDTKQGAGFWRVIARPRTPGACPVTLVLRDDQKFDLSIAGDLFEDRAIDDFALFPGLLEAVAQGRVERTHYACALTGTPLGHETHVLLEDGRTWGERRLRNGARIESGAVLENLQRFLPYRR
jgi:hypothetical protein